MPAAANDPPRTAPGVLPADLGDDELLEELASLHRKRDDALRFAPDAALSTHLRRSAELEQEYLRRHPDREVGADQWGPGEPG